MCGWGCHKLSSEHSPLFYSFVLFETELCSPGWAGARPADQAGFELRAPAAFASQKFKPGKRIFFFFVSIWFLPFLWGPAHQDCISFSIGSFLTPERLCLITLVFSLRFCGWPSLQGYLTSSVSMSCFFNCFGCFWRSQTMRNQSSHFLTWFRVW